jgi:hypothetical protein
VALSSSVCFKRRHLPPCSTFRILKCLNPGRRPSDVARARDSRRSRCPATRFERHSLISVRNFAFGAHVRPVMPASSLSVRQERVLNKTMCTGQCGTEFHGVTRAWGVKNIQRAYQMHGCKRQKLETDTLLLLWNRKFFSLLLTDYSRVWCLRAKGNGSALALSCEIVDQICHEEGVCGRFSRKRVIVKR